MNEHKKTYPKVLAFLGTLVRNPRWPLQKFRVRLIEFPNADPSFDIRQFDDYKATNTSPAHKGYNTKGVNLSFEQAVDLHRRLGRGIRIYQNLMQERLNESKAKESTTTVEEDTQEAQAD